MEAAVWALTLEATWVEASNRQISDTASTTRTARTLRTAVEWAAIMDPNRSMEWTSSSQTMVDTRTSVEATKAKCRAMETKGEWVMATRNRKEAVTRMENKLYRI